MSQSIGPFKERELAERLVKISDAEIAAYHKKRQKRPKYFYLVGLICGIGAIPSAIFNIIWLSVVLGIVGLCFLQSGRYERLRWERVYHNLMYLRSNEQKKTDTKESSPKNQKIQRHRSE